MNQQDAVYLQNTMLRFYDLLSPSARASLHRNTTVVIALVSHDNQPTLVYTVASNSTNPEIRAAADRLGLTRWDPEGINKIAGERHAEQLTAETATKLGFKVHGLAVSREPCADCGPLLSQKRIPIEWVRDPAPPPRMSGGSSPGGGVTARPGESPGTAKTTTRPAGSSRSTAHTGAPLEPVIEGTPGFKPEVGAGIGGAVQLIQAMMVGILQRAEIDKLEKRDADLQPKIDAFLASGYSVELILIVEKPNSVDLLCRTGVFCDSSQITYFRTLYISRVESVKPIIRPTPRAPTAYPTIGPAGGRESFIPYTHQGGSIIEEREIPYLSTRDKYHHTEYAKHTLYPQKSLSLTTVTRPRTRSVKPKPQLDEATKKAMAAAPSQVYLVSSNIIQDKTAYKLMQKLTGNPMFGTVKSTMGAPYIRRTRVVCFSDLDKPRADALAEIVRAEGIPSPLINVSGAGDDAPGHLQIMFGQDAEK